MSMMSIGVGPLVDVTACDNYFSIRENDKTYSIDWIVYMYSLYRYFLVSSLHQHVYHLYFVVSLHAACLHPIYCFVYYIDFGHDCIWCGMLLLIQRHVDVTFTELVREYSM